MKDLVRLMTVFLLFVPFAVGADLIAEEHEQETLHVEAEGETAPVDITGFVTTIRAEQFESRVTSLSELLREAVGLQVRSYGGLGSFATVSIRGSTSEQVNIYVDGVLMNPALGGGVNLADFSLSSVESIEIYRGFTPSFLGSAAMGGAINIRTKRPAQGGTAGSGSLSYGSYGTGEASGLVSWSRGAGTSRATEGLVSLDLTRSDGDFRFFDNNGTPSEAGDDGFETRINNRFSMGDLLGRWGLSLQSGGRVETEATVTTRRQGVPGIDAFQSPDARSEMTRALLKTGLLDDHLAGGRLSLSVDAFYTSTWQRFQDRSGGTTGGPAADSRNILDAAGPSVYLRWHPSPAAGIGQYLGLLFSARRETAERTEHLNPVPDRGRATRFAWTLGAEDEIHFAGGRVVVTPSARWERFANSFEAKPGVPVPPATRDSDSRLIGRLGAAWRPGPHLSVRANAGRFYRVPSFTELFGDQGTVSGSGDLLPEEGWNYDVGASWETDGTAGQGPLNRLHLETALFRRDADNLIQFVQTSQSHVTAQNIGKARVSGVEVSAAVGLLGCLSGDLNYTWQVAEDRSDTFRRGSDLPGRPRHEGSARASLTRSWGRPYYEFSYVGPNYFDAAAAALVGSGVSRDRLRAPGRYLHNLGFTRSLGPRLQMTLEADNIFNVKVVDVVRYPIPGRLLEAKLRVTLP